MKHITVVVLILLFQLSFSQTKNEKEERVALYEFPKEALQLISQLPKGCKRLKLYKETDNTKQSFEAKFKYKGAFYSVEFSEKGQLEDIEVLTKFKKIESQTASIISKYFKEHFSKHSIIKVQKQYIFLQNKSARMFLDSVLLKNETTNNYEIIAEVKTKSQRLIKEFTFNKNGKFLASRTLNPTSYEHILY